MNRRDLPPPPGEFMTSEQIVATIRDHWVENLGATPEEAGLRAERGFMHMLATDSIREWGFSDTGETLYEPHATPVARAIVYVLVRDK
jgi:hypothetical protein